MRHDQYVMYPADWSIVVSILVTAFSSLVSLVITLACASCLASGVTLTTVSSVSDVV